MCAQTRERGPPSAPAEILYILSDIVIYCILLKTRTGKVEILLQGKLDFISSSICLIQQRRGIGRDNFCHLAVMSSSRSETQIRHVIGSTVVLHFCTDRNIQRQTGAPIEVHPVLKNYAWNKN